MERETGGMKVCPICQKIFYVPNLKSWAYVKRSRNKVETLCCSWTCFRTDAKKVEKRRCINCGKVIIGNGKLFCDYYCRIDYEQLNKENLRNSISGKVLA